MIEHSGSSVLKMMKILNLLLPNEVSCPSKGNHAICFYDFLETFMDFEAINALLSDGLKEIWSDTAYLSELFAKFRETNLQLQESGVNLSRAVLSPFISKLILFKYCTGCCKAILISKPA